MKVPKEHNTYLAKRDYPPNCSSIIFKPEEREFLQRYGYWIEALVAGAILPVTEEEQRLIDVHKGTTEPETVNEWIWIKLIERRRFEIDAKKIPHYSVRDESEKWFSRSNWIKMRNQQNS
jgi:uncharacterized protein YifE (UPF0438 family)